MALFSRIVRVLGLGLNAPPRPTSTNNAAKEMVYIKSDDDLVQITHEEANPEANPEDEWQVVFKDGKKEMSIEEYEYQTAPRFDFASAAHLVDVSKD